MAATEDPHKTRADTRQLPVRLSSDDYNALKAYAFFTGTSMNEVMGRALRLFFADVGRQEQFNVMLRETQSTYRLALDKLKDL
jgi:hypothetical protein